MQPHRLQQTAQTGCYLNVTWSTPVVQVLANGSSAYHPNPASQTPDCHDLRGICFYILVSL